MLPDILRDLRLHPDITTQGLGVHADAEAIVYRAPRVDGPVPGAQWLGQVGQARALLRLPEESKWNGKLLIGATPAVRSEFSLDLMLGDIALQRGYAYAACDKATPLLTLRNPDRQMTEWVDSYEELTVLAQSTVAAFYRKPARRTYISGVSNGGYITRIMLERKPALFDGGVDCEGVLWHPDARHLLTSLPDFLESYPIYRNWRGTASTNAREKAFAKLLDAGLHPRSAGAWDQYFLHYWVVSLWLYGRNLDPTWAPFAHEWSNDWLQDPSLLSAYPWQERRDYTRDRIAAIANSGSVTKPLLSLAGSYDCLVPYAHHAKAYASLVADAGCAHWHRTYEVARANHVDGMLLQNRDGQQPMQPFYEAALYHLEDWVEEGIDPPDSGLVSDPALFADGRGLYSQVAKEELQ
ncbi:MAG: alpha/beta hydrolase domain-containing protein [Firmicutes bacterium]|nr:alpha/beta hydrolase domain-containing protein [Bacillota bacterium]